MASIINAATTGGLIQTADTSGILQLQTAGVTALTIDASQNVVLAKGLTVGATAAPAFNAYQSTLQSVTSTPSKILYQTEEFDTNSNFAASTFTPTVAGYYQVIGSCQVLATTSLTTVVYKNGAAYKYGTANAAATVSPLVTVSCVVYCNGTTDYLEIWANSTVTGNSNPLAANTYFQAFLARSA